MATPVAVPAAPAVVTKAPVAEKPLNGLLKKKELVWNTFTPAATQKATPRPSVPALKNLLLKVVTHPDKRYEIFHVTVLESCCCCRQWLQVID